MPQAFMDNEVPKLADGFAEPLHSMIRETPASSLVALPAMDRPPHPIHGNGVVYIGDAWHPMSPFSGKPSAPIAVFCTHRWCGRVCVLETAISHLAAASGTFML